MTLFDITISCLLARAKARSTSMCRWNKNASRTLLFSIATSRCARAPIAPSFPFTVNLNGNELDQSEFSSYYIVLLQTLLSIEIQYTSARPFFGIIAFTIFSFAIFISVRIFDPGAMFVFKSTLTTLPRTPIWPATVN